MSWPESIALWTLPPANVRAVYGMGHALALGHRV